MRRAMLVLRFATTGILVLSLAGCPSKGSDRAGQGPVDFSYGAGCADSPRGVVGADPDRFAAYTIIQASFARLVRDATTRQHVALGGAVAVSIDGGFVAVSETEKHVVIETATGREIPVSVSRSGGYAKFPLVTPFADSISADGRFVAFHHGGDDLVPGDRNAAQDVFVRDLQRQVTERLSVSSSGEEAKGDSRLPSISANGNVVSFLSVASNLAPGDTNGMEDIFVRDRTTKKTIRITTTGRGPVPSGTDRFRSARISGDGRSVVFSSTAPALVAEDDDDREDVFLHDLRSGRTVRVSQPAGGDAANGASHALFEINPASQDGTCIAFVSGATNLAPGDVGSGVFVRDMTDGSIRRVSLDPSGGALNPGGSGLAAMFPDGGAVAFVAEGRTYIRDLASATTTDVGPADPHLLPAEPRAACEGARRVGDAPSFGPQPHRSAIGAAYVSLNGGSLGVYSVSSGQSVRVLDVRRGGIDGLAFRSASALTFGVGGGRAGFALCEFDLRDGAVREIFRDEQVLSHSWSPDGRWIAYIGFTSDRAPRAAVYIREGGGPAKKILDLGVWYGNGHADEHLEERISWSPDGRYLLAGTADAGRRPAIRIVDRSGSMVTPRLFGTLGRWIGADAVIFRDSELPAEGRSAWHLLDVRTGTSEIIAIEPGTVRPAVSADGRYVVVDDAGRTPRLLLFDVERGTQRVLARGYVSAIWLEPGFVSVIKTQPCDRSADPEPCVLSPAWHPIGPTRFTIEIDTGHVAASRLRRGRETEVLYSAA